MTHTDTVKKILAIGYSVRHIVCSGCRAGYEMYAADAFGDLDTRRCACRYFPLDPLQLHADVRRLEALMTTMDGIFIGSGLENADFGFLNNETKRKILGNPPAKTKEVSNKAWLAARLDELGIPHPVTYTGREVLESDLANSSHYPVVAKPAHGGGGIANFLCNNETELVRYAQQLPEFLFQEYLKGSHASVSTLSTRKATIAVAVNEQMIGWNSLYAPGPFVYCGNITPFRTKYSARACELAELLAVELGLLGSNGVDFVITGECPVVIEVNPRIQGSLDSVERSTRLNLVAASVNAVRDGVLPEKVVAKRYAAKVIAFANQDGMVMDNFGGAGIVDIPETGRAIKEGEPIATAIGVGAGRDGAVGVAMELIARIKAGVHFVKRGTV